MTDAEARHRAWQQERASFVSGPAGNLALVSYHPVSAAPTRCGELGVEVRRVGDEAGVRIRPAGPDAVTIDDVPARGETFFGRLRADGTPRLSAGRFSADAFSLDGTGYELRVYDAQAPGLAAFDRIDTWPYDPALAVTGRLRAHRGVELVPWRFTRESDTGHAKRVPGLLSVSVLGESRDLVVFLDSGHLVLVFADQTTGTESYAPGRFLRLEPAGQDGVLEVDFNRAFVPPCGFSDFYSCPVPPPQNRLGVPVRAGERAVLWQDGRGH